MPRINAEARTGDVGVKQVAEQEAPQRTKAPIYRQQRLAQQVEVERAVESLAQAKQAMNSLAKQKAASEEFTADELPPVQSVSYTEKVAEVSEAPGSEVQVSSDAQTTNAMPTIDRDPRLGVLGTVRRHTQVL